MTITFNNGSGGSCNNSGIKSLVINSAGHLIVTFADNTIQDLGLVVGHDGTNGKNFYPDDVGMEIPDGTFAVDKPEGWCYLSLANGTAKLYFKTNDAGVEPSTWNTVEFGKGDAVVTFNETEVAPYAALTAVKTQTYIDMDLADVKADLKQRTAYERDNLINSGYHYKNADGTVDVTFPSDVNGRQMLNNYYTQAINGSQTINIYLDSGEIVTVDGDEMVEIFNGLLAQIDGYFDDAIAQQTAIDAATTIFDAQKAATFVYPDQSKIPVRN